MEKKSKFKNINSRSLIVRFNLFFFVFSVIPLGLLGYFFYSYLNGKPLEFSNNQIVLLALLVGAGCITGFFGVRNSLMKLVLLSKKLKESLLGNMDKESFLELVKEEGEIAELAKSFGDMMARLESNIKELKATKTILYRVLSGVGKTITSVGNFDLLIELVLETTVEALLAKRGAIYVLDEDTNVLSRKVVSGSDIEDAPLEVKIGEGSIGWVAKERKPLFVPVLESENEKKVGFFSPPLICVPLVLRDKMWGVILLSGKKYGDNFSEDEMRILSNLAGQIAVSLENARLSKNIEQTYFETISALALAVEAKDPYSRGHSDRVSNFSSRIAVKLGLDKKDVDVIKRAASLHDVGKIGIGDDILKKAGRLDDEEMNIMRSHSIVGETIIKPLKSFRALLDPIRHHHEKLDGSGYPDGLKGDEISLPARILSVADIFDALTSGRPYREPLSYEDCIKELDKMAEDNKIDPEVVSVLKEII